MLGSIVPTPARPWYVAASDTSSLTSRTPLSPPPPPPRRRRRGATGLAYIRRCQSNGCAALARDLWRVAGVPAWDEATATTWWRWAGHAERLSLREPTRWIARALQWRNARGLRRVRSCHATATGAPPVRLNRGHRFLGRRRWDELVQHAASIHADTDWTDITADREVWEALEPTFFQSILRRRTRPMPLPRHRHYVHSQPDLEGEGIAEG